MSPDPPRKLAPLALEKQATAYFPSGDIYFKTSWQHCPYSPFPRYFKRKGDRETLALERGYGKYTSNMADGEWLCMARKDEIWR